MLTASGTALVLLTWAVGAVLVPAMGLPLALAVERGRVTPRTLLHAMWWGLLLTAVMAALVATVVALRSPQATAVVVVLALVGAGVGAITVRRRGWADPHGWTAAAVVLAVALALALMVLAVSAVGPVTNYDTGLYHLGAIRYAMDAPTISGLANLYGPLGYGNAEFTLAGLLANGPLGTEGYRALNGLVVALAFIDVVLRGRQRRWSAGTFVLVAGLTVAVAPMLLMADYWITSPSQDATVMIVTVVCSGYLVDAVSGRTDWLPDAATSAVLGILLVMLRPTMAPFTAAVVVVLALCMWRSRVRGRARQVLTVGLLVGAAGVLAIVASAVRDYLLSGWFLYPLSVLPFDVPWRAGDPTELREATLGFWRDRQDIWGSVDGWSWIGSWFADLPDAWEAYLIGLLAITAVAALVIAGRAGVVRWRRLVLAVTPSAVGVAAWFLLSPPGFRFGWGPLFTALTIPIGWCWWRLSRASRGEMIRSAGVAGAALVLLASVIGAVVTAPDWGQARQDMDATLGPVRIPFEVVPVADAPVKSVATLSGLRLLTPTVTDQCWDAFPLCTPLASPTLRLRGAELSDGLLP